MKKLALVFLVILTGCNVTYFTPAEVLSVTKACAEAGGITVNTTYTPISGQALVTDISCKPSITSEKK